MIIYFWLDFTVKAPWAPYFPTEARRSLSLSIIHYKWISHLDWMEPYFIATRNCWVKMVVIIHEIPSLWSSTGPKKASCMCNSKSIIKYRKPLMCTMPQQEGRYLTTTLSFSSPHNILIPLICHKYEAVDDRSISYSWCYCSQMLYLYGNGLLQVIHS